MTTGMQRRSRYARRCASSNSNRKSSSTSRRCIACGRGSWPNVSKRGNTYLRTLLIHGARAALPSLSQSDTPLGRWLKAMIERGAHRNVVLVALANKLARIAWATLRKETYFDRSYMVAA